MGMGLIARAIATLFAFPFASKFMSSKKLMIFLIICSLVITLTYIPANSFTSLFIITFIFSFFYPSLLPAIESGATALVQEGNVHYGKSRSYGSIGFVVAVFIISGIISYFDENAILWCMIVSLLILLFIQAKPAPISLSEQPTVEDRKSSYSMRGLFKIKGFSLILFIVILLQGALASYYSYSYLYLQDLGVNPLYIGIILNVAVIFEIIYLSKAESVSSLTNFNITFNCCNRFHITMDYHFHISKCMGIYFFTNIAFPIICDGSFCFYSIYYENITETAVIECTRYIFSVSNELKCRITNSLGRISL